MLEALQATEACTAGQLWELQFLPNPDLSWLAEERGRKTRVKLDFLGVSCLDFF